MGLSNWGFGTRIENYQRKRKKAFEKEQQIFGQHMEDYASKSIGNQNISTDFHEIESLKNKSRDRRRILNIIRRVLVPVGVFIVIYIVFKIWTET